jgi:hypothetical protein
VGGIIAISVGTSTAAPAAKGKKSGEHRINGTIVSVQQNSITIKTHHHNNGQATAATKSYTKTFTITANTKIQVGGKNQTRPANLNALHKGEHVVVLAHKHQADVITIAHKKKKKTA